MSETGASLIKSLSPSEASTAETRIEVEKSQEWHYDYSTVVGFLSQDVNFKQNSSATEEGFDLIEQRYDTDKLWPDNGKLLTQWQRFTHKLKVMNQRAPKEVTYRLLYLGRHGQGYHNVGIMFYGDAAWDTPSQNRIEILAELDLDQTYYSSPLTRAMQTAQLTFSGLPLPPSQTFRPVVKEFLRERYGIQSCDFRPTKSYIQANFPNFGIEDSFTENDELHSPTRRESLRRQDRRVRALLDDVFAHDENTYISITSHSETIEATLRVVGHSALCLPPGGIVPVLVKVSEVSGKRHNGDEQEWEAKPACESDPLKTGKDGYKDVAELLDEINRSVPELEGMFEKILAVSIKPSWRSRGLLAAASHTNLQVTIPEQPHNSDDLVSAFEALGPAGIRKPSHGSAKAWLAHLDMIKYVVASGLSSAFIIEDDLDWDTAIHEQMRLVSDNVRNFTGTPVSDPSPFGNAWDVLWLGHCGEVTHPDTERLQYRDPSLMANDLYAGWTKKYLVNIQEGHRAVQQAVQTVCTFGYGINRRGARNILKVLGRGQEEAFDVAMMKQCQQKNLYCISINPELFHHYNPKDGTGYVSPNGEANGSGKSSDEEAFENIMGTTANMKHSARCEALFNARCPQPPTDPNAYR
ncbi:hypothetical protein AYL99_08343 [Fonsecaea erecta]|uniref:Phosphoglycerate mutase n=1 Tax=Fonsecaea erecta TaxID=1367422 RepID=A0A178ZEX1_9EURO|nr:hypothetical protein AYL99_08343 [Fonsecaea erecta]OAP57605.1 hypothetical protein AYL99_08343 [Fonsecaea erecta]